MSRLRLSCLVVTLSAFLISGPALAQKQQSTRAIRIDDGINVQVSPIWQSQRLNGATKLELTIAEGSALRMVVYFTVEKRRSASDALQRAAEIAGPPSREDRLFLVNGWPAVQATRTIDLPQISQQEKPEPQKEGMEKAEVEEHTIPKFERTITAVAATTRTLIIEQRLYDLADQSLREAGRELVGRVKFTHSGDEAIGKRALDGIAFVRKNLFERPSGLVEVSPAAFPFFREVTTTTPVRAHTGPGEVAMAASTNGVKVAIATNSGWARSNDSGVTYVGGNGFPASIANQGDPALAYGGKGDNFYLGYLGRPAGGGAAGTATAVNGCTVSVDRSADGQTYTWAGHARFCASSFTTGSLICAPDQEQIAAEWVRRRFRGPRPLPVPKDQIYLGWRQFTATATATSNTCAGLGSGNVVIELSCSSDSGATWTPPIQITGGGDRPRLAVGPDGFVYVVYSVLQRDATGTVWQQIYLDKYSSCKKGFVHQWGYPRTVVSNAQPQTCDGSIPGLDRCDGDAMNSPTVTVSDFDPKGMVVIVYSDGTFNGSDRVIAALAPNGGFNVTSTHLLSDNAKGRKFLPWACAEGRNVYATWYDRRNATQAAPDSTDFFAGWMRLDNFGPTVHSNVNLTGASDPQCASGWPNGTRDQTTATSCPGTQLAGLCTNATGATAGNCNFNFPLCPPTFRRCRTGPGAPKYGDYNASACAAGRLFAAWTSATTPTGSATAAAGLSTFTRTVQPRVP